MPIVLLSDLGSTSYLPGAMKGIIAGIAPDASVIDLTHALSGGVQHAALTLLQAVKYFPTGTIFCVVSRASTARPIAAQAGSYFFVGRDDGLLSYVLYSQPHAWATDITDALDGEMEQSLATGWALLPATAALIHAGAPLETLGEPVPDLYGLDAPPLDGSDTMLDGEIIAVDGEVALTSIGLLRWTTSATLVVRPLVGEGVWTVEAATAQVACGGLSLRGIRHSGSGGVPVAVAAGEFLEIHSGGTTLTVGQPVRLTF